jgi:hypothetical protein
VDGDLRPDARAGASGQHAGAPYLTLVALFCGGAYLSHLANLGSNSWPFLLRIHPSEPRYTSLTCLIDLSFGEIGEHPSALL